MSPRRKCRFSVATLTHPAGRRVKATARPLTVAARFRDRDRREQTLFTGARAGNGFANHPNSFCCN